VCEATYMRCKPRKRRKKVGELSNHYCICRCVVASNGYDLQCRTLCRASAIFLPECECGNSTKSRRGGPAVKCNWNLAIIILFVQYRFSPLFSQTDSLHLAIQSLYLAHIGLDDPLSAANDNHGPEQHETVVHTPRPNVQLQHYIEFSTYTHFYLTQTHTEWTLSMAGLWRMIQPTLLQFEVLLSAWTVFFSTQTFGLPRELLIYLSNLVQLSPPPLPNISWHADGVHLPGTSYICSGQALLLFRTTVTACKRGVFWAPLLVKFNIWIRVIEGIDWCSLFRDFLNYIMTSFGSHHRMPHSRIQGQ